MTEDGAATRSPPDGPAATLACMDETVITSDGLRRLTAELERLTTVGRSAIPG